MPEFKSITLPRGEEMATLLAGIRSGNHVAEYLHPIIVEYGGGKFLSAPGIIMMVHTAFEEYLRTPSLPREAFIAEAWLEPYVRALVQDEEVLGQALKLLARRQGTPPSN